VVLEANARPGLAIQVANRCGMLNRLRWVKANARPRMSIDERHELVRRLVAEV
jgi:hypothetical protein